MNWEEIFSKKYKTKNKEVVRALKKLEFSKKFIIFNVVGTNGKGSVSNYLSQIYVKRSKKVGLFTSPHIFSPYERIQIDGQPISEMDFNSIYNKVISVMETKKINFFKLTYIIALYYFYINEVDVVILEAGIGGRKDITNLINGDYCALSSIGLDHRSILGETLVDISNDKSFIINKNMQVFIPTSIDDDLVAPFLEKGVALKSKCILINNEGLNYIERNKKFVAGIEDKIFDDAIRTNVQTPLGRASKLRFNGVESIYDVAHNEQGLRAIYEYLETIDFKVENILLSVNVSKEIPQYLFENKNLFVYQFDRDFKTHNDFIGATEVNNLEAFLNNMPPNTLITGSFYIGKRVLNAADKK